MQFTAAQRRFYIDPVQDPTIQTERILVTEERVPRNIHLDKIVAVKKERTFYNSRLWWVTEEGDHVAGAPVTPPTMPLYVTDTALALIPDGSFWLGSNTRSRPSGGTYTLRDPKRSDCLSLPGVVEHVNTMTFPDVVRAAPWAGELMPLPGDSDAVITAKVSLAEQRWTHRRAKAVLLTEGVMRDWADDLDTLRENHEMPDAEFVVQYSGKAMLNANGSPSPELNTYDTGRIESIGGRASRLSTIRNPAIALEVTALLTGVTIKTRDEMRELSYRSIQSALQAAIGDYDTVPGEHTLTPVLRSVS